MKYYIIAGEPSGDLHGANLMAAIQEKDQEARFMFWGGDQMLAIDAHIVTHIRETAIMGFVEVAKNLGRINGFFKKAKDTIAAFRPDVVVFIDYPGFNLRMAKWAKKAGFKTVYYISPQLWAWKKGRMKTVKRYIDEMIVILPFELDFYRENGIDAHYVGHPLVPVIQSYQADELEPLESESTKQKLAILPGSRLQEIKKMLPLLTEAAADFDHDYDLYVGMAPNVPLTIYQELTADSMATIHWIQNRTYDLLSVADLALVTSGTATLETALFGVPQVVCYKTGMLNYEIGKRLVDLSFISLVNLIAGEKIVPELIQHEVNKKAIVHNLHQVKENEEEMKRAYDRLRTSLEVEASPSALAAKVICDLVVLV